MVRSISRLRDFGLLLLRSLSNAWKAKGFSELNLESSGLGKVKDILTGPEL